MSRNYITKFKDNYGVDLGGRLVAREYMIDLYPELSLTMKTPLLLRWGYNSFGSVGDNSTTSRSSPVQTIACSSNWKQVSAGYYVSGAIKTDGTLWMWGYNNTGQLGDNSVTHKSSPVQTVSAGTTWRTVDVNNGFHTAAIKTDGTLWMWGKNNQGQLGDNSVVPKSSPVQTIAVGTNWKQVSAGYDHTAAIKTDGTLWMWGSNSVGQLGDNSVVPKSSPVQTIAVGTNWKQVSAGRAITAAVKTDGTLWVWGSNQYGTLGNNTIADRSSPVQTIAVGSNWTSVSCGYFYILATKTDGTLWTWGKNNQGQLGDNSIANKSSPVQTIAVGTNWKQVSNLGLGPTSYGLKQDGTLWTWGANTIGQLGNNTTIDKSSPVQVLGSGSWMSVSGSAGIFDQTQNSLITGYRFEKNATSGWPDGVDFGDAFVPRAQFAQGGLWSWGNNYPGLLGTGGMSETSSPVQIVSFGNNWIQVAMSRAIASGDGHSAGIKTDGTLWLWGRNGDGQHGDSTRTDRSSPIQTVGSGWKSVALGNRSTAAIKTDGTLWTMGINLYGTLGDNTTVAKSSPVQTVAVGTNWSTVLAGQFHYLAIKTDGTLWGWGHASSGQLGDNSTTHKSSPVQTIAVGTNWKQVSAGGSNSAGVKTDGTLWVWGYNGYGMLGDGTITTQSSPVQTVAGGTNWKVVSVGSGTTQNFMAGIKTDGTLWTWGRNTYGNLGDGTTTMRSSPVQTIAGGTTWKDVACGEAHIIAQKTDGSIWAWGNNNRGQLGDGSTTARSSPVQILGSDSFNWAKITAGQSCGAALRWDEFESYIT